MKAVTTIIGILLIAHISFGQFASPGFADKGSYSAALIVNNEVGGFAKTMKSPYVSVSALGISFQYLRNPKFKADQESMVQIGAEIGFSGRTQSDFFTVPVNNVYFMTHREFFINSIVKIRPIMKATKFNPFMEAFFGPKFYSSKLMESQSDNQSYLVQAFNSNSLNYGVSAGVGYKISKISNPGTYIDFAVVYSESNPVKLINRNKIGLDNNYNIITAQNAVKPQNVVLKIGVTRYF